MLERRVVGKGRMSCELRRAKWSGDECGVLGIEMEGRKLPKLMSRRQFHPTWTQGNRFSLRISEVSETGLNI
jgi:hypothetical protein